MIHRTRAVMFLVLAGILNLGLVAIGLFFCFFASTFWGCLFLGAATFRALADAIGTMAMRRNAKVAAVALAHAEEIQKTSRELSQVLDGNNALITLAFEQDDTETVQKLAIQGYNAQVIYRARILTMSDSLLEVLRQYK